MTDIQYHLTEEKDYIPFKPICKVKKNFWKMKDATKVKEILKDPELFFDFLYTYDLKLTESLQKNMLEAYPRFEYYHNFALKILIEYITKEGIEIDTKTCSISEILNLDEIKTSEKIFDLFEKDERLKIKIKNFGYANWYFYYYMLILSNYSWITEIYRDMNRFVSNLLQISGVEKKPKLRSWTENKLKDIVYHHINMKEMTAYFNRIRKKVEYLYKKCDKTDTAFNDIDKEKTELEKKDEFENIKVYDDNIKKIDNLEKHFKMYFGVN